MAVNLPLTLKRIHQVIAAVEDTPEDQFDMTIIHGYHPCGSVGCVAGRAMTEIPEARQFAQETLGLKLPPAEPHEDDKANDGWVSAPNALGKWLGLTSTAAMALCGMSMLHPYSISVDATKEEALAGWKAFARDLEANKTQAHQLLDPDPKYL